jgi:hypothetical protein
MLAESNAPHEFPNISTFGGSFSFASVLSVGARYGQNASPSNSMTEEEKQGVYSVQIHRGAPGSNKGATELAASNRPWVPPTRFGGPIRFQRFISWAVSR